MTIVKLDLGRMEEDDEDGGGLGARVGGVTSGGASSEVPGLAGEASHEIGVEEDVSEGSLGGGGHSIVGLVALILPASLSMVVNAEGR